MAAQRQSRASIARTLSGSLSFVPFADAADAFLVTANEGDETALCLVPRTAKGLVDRDHAQCRRLDVERAQSSTGSQIAGDQIVAQGAKAAAIADRMQELLLLGTAVELLGTAQAALDITLAYIKLREQFGKPIGSFQALQHRAVELLRRCRAEPLADLRGAGGLGRGHLPSGHGLSGQGPGRPLRARHRARRAATARRHRLYRRARHRHLLQARGGARRQVRQRDHACRPLLRADACRLAAPRSNADGHAASLRLGPRRCDDHVQPAGPRQQLRQRDARCAVPTPSSSTAQIPRCA